MLARRARIILIAGFVCALSVSSVGRALAAESAYLYGIHDHDPQPTEYLNHITNVVPSGWITATVAIGHDPNDNSGVDFTWYQNHNITVICRLNNGYFPNGTIPLKESYADFARRCANFVRNSPGCRIWVIGNELNIPGEWPAFGNHLAYVEPIDYGSCYRQCYNAIKAVDPAHKVIPSASAPFSGPFSSGTTGGYTYDACPLGWVDHQYHILNQCQATGPVDGIALHVFSRGYTYDDIHDPGKHWTNGRLMYWSFYVYKDWIDFGIPSAMYNLPVYITECDGYFFWKGGTPENPTIHYEPGFVQEVYKEIDSYNRTVAVPQNKPVIRCVNMYRWCAWCDGWNIDGDNPYKSQILSDLDAAIALQYSWPGSAPALQSWSDDFNDGILDVNAPEPVWIPSTQSGGSVQESDGWLKLVGSSGNASRSDVKTAYRVYKDIIIDTKLQLADAASADGSGGSAEIRFRADVNGIGYALAFRPNGGSGTISLRRTDTGEIIQGKEVSYNLPSGTTLYPYIKTDGSNLQVKVGTTAGGSDVVNWSLSDTTFPGAGGFQLVNDRLMDVRFDYFNYQSAYPGIQGTVRDNYGKPIAGVTVSTNIGGYAGTTETDGTYLIANMAAGTYNVTASKTGYGPKTTSNVSLTSGTIILDFALTDNSKPPNPVVEDGPYQTNPNSITFSWTCSDPESGIVEYRAAIAKSTNVSDLMPGGDWRTTGLATSHTRTGLTLTNGNTYYCMAKAKNGVNLVSNAGISDGVKIAKLVAGVSGAKSEPDNRMVALDDRIVTASLSDCIYVEDQDRTSGIKVMTTGVAEGTIVDLAGLITTVDGERRISGYSILPGEGGHFLEPYVTMNRSFYGELLNSYTPGVTKGFGLNNIGLLMITCGKVTEVGAGYFIIKDGAPKKLTLKVSYPSDVTPPSVGTFVKVTGINTVEAVTLYPVLRLRKPSDLWSPP